MTDLNKASCNAAHRRGFDWRHITSGFAFPTPGGACKCVGDGHQGPDLQMCGQNPYQLAAGYLDA